MIFNDFLVHNREVAATAGQITQKNYYYHDIRIICQTNHPVLRAALEAVFGMFPEPAVVRGEASYALFCYESACQFPLPLPDDLIYSSTLSLLNHAQLKAYRSQDHTTNYLHFVTHSSANESALSIVRKEQHSALTQLEMPERYDPTFLRRYILLLTLGELLETCGFEACHAAAITAPWNDRLGALILGTSGSGKTTLSLGCACSGYGLIGDDLVMLRQGGAREAIKAYALLPEVSIRNGTLDLWSQLSFLRTYPMDERAKRSCPIEEIRPGATRQCAPVHSLFFPSLTNALISTITPLSKVATLQLLIGYCISKENMSAITQERLFRLLTALTEQASGYQLAIARGDESMPHRLYTLLREAQT